MTEIGVESKDLGGSRVQIWRPRCQWILPRHTRVGNAQYFSLISVTTIDIVPFHTPLVTSRASSAFYSTTRLKFSRLCDVIFLFSLAVKILRAESTLNGSSIVGFLLTSPPLLPPPGHVSKKSHFDLSFVSCRFKCYPWSLSILLSSSPPSPTLKGFKLETSPL